MKAIRENRPIIWPTLLAFAIFFISICGERLGYSKEFDLNELVKAAKRSYEEAAAAYDADVVNEETVYLWSRRWMVAETLTGRHLAAAEEHYRRMQKLHKSNEAVHGEPETKTAPLANILYYLLEAQMQVERAKATVNEMCRLRTNHH
jgi:hypothetical protein